MRNDRPPYYKVRRGRAFFELGRERAAASSMNASTPLGADGDNARAAAWRLYYEWRSNSGKGGASVKQRAYPKGSLGSFFDAYRQTKAWAKKSDSTRTEWFNCWKYLEPQYATRRINSITPAEFAEFQDALEEQHGQYVRWRVVKIARALFNAAINNHVITASPAKSLPNPMPKGRREIWRAAEIAKLVQVAGEVGKPAMALAIKLAWETGLQPVDVRALSLGMRYRNASGSWFETQRSKTDAPVISAITEELNAEIDGYIEGLGLTLPPDQPFLRTSRDAHSYRKARFIEDFAIVRRAAFGDDENRRFQDIRRSANIEAQIGGATAEERAALLANNLDKDKALDATYTPATVERSRQIAEKRAIGRRYLAVQSVNTTGENGK